MEILITVIFVVILLAGFIIYNIGSWGYVTFKFWHWFIMPIFPNMPNLDFWQCVGLSFFFCLFRNHSHISIKDEYRDKNSETVGIIIMPWIILLMGSFFKLN